jgi:hypothetical protein
MSDEYFNNLAAVECTIQEFFQQGYQPLNEDQIAVVYLFTTNQKKTKVNQLQYESSIIKEMQDSNEHGS